jgi:hypothetical protein
LKRGAARSRNRLDEMIRSGYAYLYDCLYLIMYKMRRSTGQTSQSILVSPICSSVNSPTPLLLDRALVFPISKRDTGSIISNHHHNAALYSPRGCSQILCPGNLSGHTLITLRRFRDPGRCRLPQQRADDTNRRRVRYSNEWIAETGF